MIVIPNEHVASLETIDDALLGAVYATVRRIAVAMTAAYGCTGTSTRQHNGPGAGQEVPHLHVHVFPRADGDRLYVRDPEFRWATPGERAPYAARLRAALRGV